MVTVFIRSLILVGAAVLAMRLMGKRQIGQLQPFELVIAIMIADLAATPMESHDIPLWRGIIPMAACIVLHQLLTLLSLKSQVLRVFFSGSPTVIIRKGIIDFQALEKLCFNLNDLMEELRSCGILSPSEVGTAIMETSGKLSVFPNEQSRPVTPKDLRIQTGYEGIPLTLVMDGKVQKHNLTLCGRERSWLDEQIKVMGFDQVTDLLLCYIDTDGIMVAHGYEAKPPTQVQVLASGEVNW